MMVTFVSQCEKNALKKTRRVLDAFADRIGDNTWQTIITEEGLSTVKKMLRQTASKSTAVSCHWIRSRSRSQLIWVVGNKARFDEQGVVPVNYTQKEIKQFENDWYYLPLIKALTALAALFHDWGKATALFQKKLKNCSQLSDPIRHEWISCLLLNALIQNSGSNDDDIPWLTLLANGTLDETQLKTIVNQQEQKPLKEIPPAAKLISWLIVSHHRMPLPLDPKGYLGEPAPTIDSISKLITQAWGYKSPAIGSDYQQRLNACFDFPCGLLSQSTSWLKQLKKWAQHLQDCLPMLKQSLEDGSYRLVLHYARLCLMLGDHYYSSQGADKYWQDTTGLFANTDRKTKTFKQKLDEHLVGVAKNALRTAHLLPAFEQEPPVAQGITALKKTSAGIFRWQDTAVEKIRTWQEPQGKMKVGFFAVNMASTGFGKTFANAKIMRALSVDGDSLRYILALGLRTLTLQTGDEYRERVGLDNSELAVLIGSKTITELHNQTEKINESLDEQVGSESLEPLLNEDVDYDCIIPEEGLATVLKEQRDRKFLYSPVLACTIDHLMAATETKRGGRYILPCLRLMSSDLVIDEVDDFNGSDLIAIGRLIHLAGMLGRKVMISSATIPPDLAEGYFNAYRTGWLTFSKTREASNNIGCAWIDEFATHVITSDKFESNDAINAYRDSHQKFVAKRVGKLTQQPPKRKADIIECKSILNDFEFDEPETKQAQYFRET
jgi:CRISPR-associated endonuclease/helicase Cas3